MGSLVSSVFGMDKGTDQAQAGIEAGERYAKDVYFKPVTIASTLAKMTGSAEGDYSAVVTPRLLGLSETALGGAEKFYGTLAGFDAGSVAQQLYQQEYEMLKPTLAQQQIQAQERMFGGGRLGLKLAGEAVGAGTSAGLVSPDAFGLGQAQSQMLGQLALGARERALAEAGTYGQLGAGLMGTVAGIEQIAQGLIAQGVDAQSARSAAAAAAGQVGTGGYNMATQAAMAQDQAMGSFWGGLFGGVGSALGGSSVTSLAGGGTKTTGLASLFPSDKNLKTDIKLLGTLPNGLNWYSWSWNDKAKEIGADMYPTVGVIAQEVAKVIPEAIHKVKDYLAVDYSKVLEA